MTTTQEVSYRLYFEFYLLLNRKYINSVTNEQREQQLKIEEHIANLTSELSNAKEEMTNMRIEKQELELRAQTAPTLERK